MFEQINPMQAMLDAWSAEQMKERAGSQMTLGRLIERLYELRPDVLVKISEPHSYRGYYSDLAFETGDSHTTRQAAELCESVMGQVLTGYKGGDFPVHVNVPVWIAEYGSCGRRLMAVNADGSLALAEDD